MAASLGVIVGTLGPWATIVVFTLNGLETSWWGITTLTLGALCGVALLVVFYWTRTPFHPRWAVPFAWAVAVAAVACLTLSLPTLIKVITIPKTDILGMKIGPAVGWGLWLLVFSSATLCVTATIEPRWTPS
jgi:hypothetical protein